MLAAEASVMRYDEMAKKRIESCLPHTDATIADIVKALLKTPSPPASDPSTLQKKPAKTTTPSRAR